MKILAIGNSFSTDATRYLHALGNAAGVKLKVVNLFIGGCSLRTHYINATEDKRAYSMEFNGQATGFYVSIKEALCSDEFDVVTVQQCSHQSFDYKSYQPYLDYLASYIRKYAPHARIAVHKTWAYEEHSARLESVSYASRGQMFTDLSAAYEKAAEAIGADLIIPAADLVERLSANGLRAHRDTFHLSLGIGRFAVAALWLKVLTGVDPTGIRIPLDVEITDEEIDLVFRSLGEVSL